MHRWFRSNLAAGMCLVAFVTAVLLIALVTVQFSRPSRANVALAAPAKCEIQSGWSDRNDDDEEECEPTATWIPASTATNVPTDVPTDIPTATLDPPTNTPEPIPTETATATASVAPTDTPTAAPTQTQVVAAAVHFSDDFESGSFTQWTSAPVGIVTQSSDAFSGVWSANATSTGNQTYVRTTLEAAQTEIYVRIRFKVLSQGSSSAVNLGRLRTAADRSILGVLVTGGGRIGFINDVAGSQSFLAIGPADPVVTKGVWHEIQIHVRTGGNALTELWYDGAQVNSLTRTSINLGTNSIGRLQLGENASTGKRYSILFDDVAAESDFIPYSGPVNNPPPPDAPTATALPADTPTTPPIPVASATATLTPTNSSTATPAPTTNPPQPTPTNSATANPTATRTPTSVSTATAPPTPTPTRTPGAGGTAILLAAGDISTCSNNNDEATAKLLDGLSGTVADLGDNVYESGSPSEYADCYDPTWGRHKNRTRPAPGNHEYLTSGASGYYGYFGAAAGDPSTGYYSYDLGSWHIVVINSNVSMAAGSAQETWLRADLAAHPNSCTLAYWHHPRFSSGTNHGSSTASRPIWQALWDYNAEIVLNGHEHNYERFAPQDAAGNADPQRGIREFVAGTGGKSHYPFGAAIANSEVRNSDTYGILELTLGPDGYSWRFVPEAGKTFTDSGSGTCH
jgi:hypothetical protein